MHRGFFCKISGHNWEHGQCRRCGETHEKHQWEQMPGKCKLRCLVCGFDKETAHQWMPFDGTCREKCAFCSEERASHRWVLQGCIRVCSKCGKSEGKHHWMKIVHSHAKPHPDTYSDGCKCTECGATNPYGEHRFEQVQENSAYVIKCSVCGFVKSKQPAEDTVKSRDEYDANADEGIFNGGVRGGW